MAFRVNASRRLLNDNFGNPTMVNSPSINMKSNEQKLTTQGLIKQDVENKSAKPYYNPNDLNAVENNYDRWKNIKPLEMPTSEYKPDYTGATNMATNGLQSLEGTGLFKGKNADLAGISYAGFSDRAVARQIGKETMNIQKAAGSTAKEARQLGREAKNLTKEGLGVGQKTAMNPGGWSNAQSIGAGIGLGIIGEVGKQHSLKNDRYDNAAIFGSMGTGASIGSIAGPIGTVAGAAVGLIFGAIKGNKDQKAFKKNRREQQAAINTANAELNRDKRIATARAGEMQRQATIMQGLGSRTAWYKEGGELDLPTFKIQNDTKLIPLPVQSATKIDIPIFKKGGVVKFSAGNVILNGPSHEENNGLLDNDKGLPIIKDGIKVAEIESEELVLNASAMKKIEEYRRRAKAGDKDALKALGTVLIKELRDNTFDYRDLSV